MICFSGLRRTLYRPGSSERSLAAWSNRSIMDSNGFSSARKVSFSGRMPARCASDLIAGSLISLVAGLWFRNARQLQRRVEGLLQVPPVALPVDRERRHQGLGGLVGPSAPQFDGVLLRDYN